MVGKRDARVRLKRVLVAVDESPSSASASRYATEIAQKLPAELIFLHVIPKLSKRFSPGGSMLWLDEYYTNYERKGEELIDSLASSALRKGVRVKKEIQIAESSVVEGIVSSATRNWVGLIAVGFRGHGSLKRLFLGSVSHGVLNRANFPVMIVK